jgi:hypothetical protein
VVSPLAPGSMASCGSGARIDFEVVSDPGASPRRRAIAEATPRWSA